MNKEIVGSVVISSFVLSDDATAIAQNTTDVTDPNYQEQLSTPKLNNSERSYQYPDNSQSDISKFEINKQKVEQRKLKSGLQLKSIRLVKYNDYIEIRKKTNTGVIENMQVHPNRQVFLVEIDAPNGLELPSKPILTRASPLNNNVKNDDEPKTIKLKKAKLFYVFDAETNDFLNSDIDAVNEL